MEALTIEIVNPKAKQLIKDLANLKLINISKKTRKKPDFKAIVNRLRSKSDKVPTLAEISKEVEIVRADRYARKSK
jgi:hypothetical protein